MSSFASGRFDRPAVRELVAREPQEAYRQLEVCEHHIRQEQRLEHSLQSQSTEELTACASKGPIVIVNTADMSSDAIPVLPSGPLAIAVTEVASKAPEAFKRALGRNRAIDDSDTQRDIESDVQLEHSTEVLSCLWSSCVKPVLQELTCYIPSPASDRVQCVWWIEQAPPALSRFTLLASITTVA
jgi:hypothetical protein